MEKIIQRRDHPVVPPAETAETLPARQPKPNATSQKRENCHNRQRAYPKIMVPPMGWPRSRRGTSEPLGHAVHCAIQGGPAAMQGLLFFWPDMGGNPSPSSCRNPGMPRASGPPRKVAPWYGRNVRKIRHANKPRTHFVRKRDGRGKKDLFFWRHTRETGPIVKARQRLGHCSGQEARHSDAHKPWSENETGWHDRKTFQVPACTTQ